MAKVPRPGGALEQAVLAEVWRAGSISARDIWERVGRPAGLVYTTVAKVLDRLHDKGLLQRGRVGRSFVYRARVPRATVERAQARDTVSKLLGSELAVANLVDAVEWVDPALLDELARVVAARRRQRRG